MVTVIEHNIFFHCWTAIDAPINPGQALYCFRSYVIRGRRSTYYCRRCSCYDYETIFHRSIVVDLCNLSSHKWRHHFDRNDYKSPQPLSFTSANHRPPVQSLRCTIRSRFVCERHRKCLTGENVSAANSKVG